MRANVVAPYTSQACSTRSVWCSRCRNDVLVPSRGFHNGSIRWRSFLESRRGRSIQSCSLIHDPYARIPWKWPESGWRSGTASVSLHCPTGRTRPSSCSAGSFQEAGFTHSQYPAAVNATAIRVQDRLRALTKRTSLSRFPNVVSEHRHPALPDRPSTGKRRMMATGKVPRISGSPLGCFAL